MSQRNEIASPLKTIFLPSSHLTQHAMDTTHSHRTSSPETPVVSCPECNKTVLQNNLAQHVILHRADVEELKTPCPYPHCNFRTLQKSSLTRHINRRHLEKRPHKCSVPGCSATYTHAGHLSQHERLCHGYFKKENRKSKSKAQRSPMIRPVQMSQKKDVNNDESSIAHADAALTESQLQSFSPPSHTSHRHHMSSCLPYFPAVIPSGQPYVFTTTQLHTSTSPMCLSEAATPGSQNHNTSPTSAQALMPHKHLPCIHGNPSTTVIATRLPYATPRPTAGASIIGHLLPNGIHYRLLHLSSFPGTNVRLVRRPGYSPPAFNNFSSSAESRDSTLRLPSFKTAFPELPSATSPWPESNTNPSPQASQSSLSQIHPTPPRLRLEHETHLPLRNAMGLLSIGETSGKQASQ